MEAPSTGDAHRALLTPTGHTTERASCENKRLVADGCRGGNQKALVLPKKKRVESEDGDLKATLFHPSLSVLRGGTGDASRSAKGIKALFSLTYTG